MRDKEALTQRGGDSRRTGAIDATKRPARNRKARRMASFAAALVG